MTRTALVVGGGPGGLMAAEVLATAGVAVTVVEHMPSVGRKLLLAGRSGLNLTHAEPDLAARFDPPVRAAVEAYPPAALRAWCEGLGQPTFVGTSGRVFPEAMRATPLLRAWLARLDGLGVTLRTRTRWDGTTAADVAVLALGGASWPRVGSDGGWVDVVRSWGVRVEPLVPANCGFHVAWTPRFVERFAGTPIKGAALAFAGAKVRGDPVVTRTGIEGGPVYALAAALRDAGPGAILTIDLAPDRTVEDLAARLAVRPKDSTARRLERAGVAPVAAGLLREVTGNRLPADLAPLIKAVPLRLEGPRPIERAISSAGGIALDELDADFMLRGRPGTFACGEMLDWEAPTGGYLLQATFSTAVAAARGALRRLAGVRSREA